MPAISSTGPQPDLTAGPGGMPGPSAPQNPLPATDPSVTPPPATATSLFQSWMAAAEHGASIVYHDIVGVTEKVSEWEATHPVVGPLVQQAVAYAESALSAAGIPVPEMISAGTAIWAALKKFAALDSTVDSGK